MLSQLSLWPWHDTAVRIYWRTSSRFKSLPLSFAFKMRTHSGLVCIALFLCVSRMVSTQMPTSPTSAKCCQSNSHNDANAAVHPTTAVNCSFTEGLCSYKQGCFDEDMEEWSVINGSAGVKQKSNVLGGDVCSILETPVVNVTTTSCLEFTFARERPYQLGVFLAYSNKSQRNLVYFSDDVMDKTTVPERITIPPFIGKIQFSVRGGGSPNLCFFPKLYNVTIFEDCSETPDGTSSTAPDKHWSMPNPCTQVSVTTTPSTRHLISSDRTVSKLSTVDDMTSHDFHPSNSDVESVNSGAVIAGVVVAVVVVLIVVVIIVIIVYKRKHHQSKPDDEHGSNEDLSMRAGGTTTGSTATERRGNPFSRRDGDYTDIDLATTPSSDINPYELADDGTNTNGSLGPNLQRLKGSKEDDYSRIDEAQPAAAHSEKNSTPERPNPNDVYSVVNKPGKKTPTPEYSLAKIVGDTPALPNPNDVYSVVNKKGKTFDPATKPGQPDTEYNTISHNGNNTSSQKAASGDATPDTYNRISAVPSLGLNEKGRATTKPEDGLLTDDYNKLNLAGNGSMKENSGAVGAAYDHVRNDPGDAYSKARVGQRNVVIDSDYHRLKP